MRDDFSRFTNFKFPVDEKNHKNFSFRILKLKKFHQKIKMASVYGIESNLVEEKTMKQNGGMSNALSIAAHLGFPVRFPPSQNLSFVNDGDKSCDFVRLLHELTIVQGKVSDLQVQLQGRKEDKSVGHLTHVSEMDKKIETLARITTILKSAIQNKDRIIARLQQPHSLDFIPVEAEYQKQFTELIMKAARDYGTLTTSVSDLQWAENFKEPPSVWGEMLRPIPVALAQCARYFEAMNAMRECFTTLQALRSFSSRMPSEYHSRMVTPLESECVSPYSPGTESGSDDLELRSVIMQDVEKQQEEDDKYTDVEDINEIRLASPSDNEDINEIRLASPSHNENDLEHVQELS